MSDPIRQIIEALPLVDGSDVDALTAEFTGRIDDMHQAVANRPKGGEINQQCEKLVKAIEKLDDVLLDLHDHTQEIIWTDVDRHVVIKDLDHYPDHNEIRALLKPIRDSAERIRTKKRLSNRGTKILEPALVGYLGVFYTKATGLRPTRVYNENLNKDTGQFLRFVTQAFQIANIKSSPANQVKQYVESL